MYKFILFFIFLSLSLYSQKLKINEVLSSNTNVIKDENNNSPDFIELFNYGSDIINLEAYRISDKNDFASAWKFPSTIINPGKTFLIYADGKNVAPKGYFSLETRSKGIVPFFNDDHFSFLYTKISGDFEAILKLSSFRNANLFGACGLILRENLTKDSRYAGVFYSSPQREVFTVMIKDSLYQGPKPWFDSYMPLNFTGEEIKIIRKGDSLGFWLNVSGCGWVPAKRETEFFKFNNNGFYLGIAASSHSLSQKAVVSIPYFKINGVEADLSEFKLASIGEAYDDSAYFSHELHTDFELNSNGEKLYLWDSAGNLIDTLSYPPLPPEVSYGCLYEGSKEKAFFDMPTPNEPNKNPKSGISFAPEFSLEQGFLSSKSYLTINHPNPQAKIYYSLGGYTPADTSKLYTGEEITLDSNTVIRALAFEPGNVKSSIASGTFLIGEESYLPVINVVASPYDLYRKDGGILVFPYSIYGNDEIPVHFDFFVNKNIAESLDAGLKLHGHASRSLDQKSFRIYSRALYGDKKFNYDYFGKSSLKSYDKLVIRNSGQDWWSGYIRDGFISVLVEKNPRLNSLKFLQTVLFLNGNYWGIYDLRERLDEEYIASRYNVPKESINLLEGLDVVNYGSCKEFSDTFSKIMALDSAGSNNFEIIDSLVNLSRLNDYLITNLYAANYDWPENNQKFWNCAGGKWMWELYDFDLSFGQSFARPDVDMYKTVFRSAGPFAKFFKKIILNEKIKIDHINRTADLLNTDFAGERAKYIIDSLSSIIRAEMPRHQHRWDSVAHNWDSTLAVMKNFADKRPDFHRECVRKFYNLDKVFPVRIDINAKGSGSVAISTLELNNFPFVGKYFSNVPVKIKALPADGYIFESWTGLDSSVNSSEIEIFLTGELDIIANFKLKTVLPDTLLVINEIMYKPADSLDCGDWVELWNKSPESLDISGWKLKDNNDSHVFVFPRPCVLLPDESLIVSADTLKFNKHYFVSRLVGNLNFGFDSSKDIIRLYDNNDALIDSVPYEAASPWPANASGTGRSIELINFRFNNALGESWNPSSKLLGTPGEINTDSHEIALVVDELLIYPVPYNGPLWLEINLDSSANVSSVLYDMLGNQIAVILNEECASGKIIRHFDLDKTKLKMPAGSYIVKTQIGNKTFHNHIIYNAY